MYTPKYLPKSFFKSDIGYISFHEALLRIGCFGREVPEVMTLTMRRLCEKHDMSNIHIEWWDDLTDIDGKTVRNMLRVSKDGKPVSRCRDYDLLNYMSLCLQFVDDRYAEFVDAWSYCRVMRIEDDEEE